MEERAKRNAYPHDTALVVGAGLSGMQTALLLAETGRKAVLLDSAPGIGGSLHLLDRTFPTDSCGLCIGSPVNPTYCPSLECSIHPNVTLVPYAEVARVDGSAGDFSVEILRKPRYVDVDRCNLCGECARVCPVARPDSLEGGLHPVKAIYAPPARAVPGAYVIDEDYCTWCGACATVCPTDAIDYGMQERRETLRVGAIVLSPGFQPFDARKKGEFGFGHLSNVITSLQFERMTSAPGSTRGRLVRPSDGRPPERIAFIQCVGSRDPTVSREYCSSVCCMHTAKQARAAVEAQPGVNVTVFHMDLRAAGKGYDEYLDAVRGLPGVSYRRAMVSSVKQHPRTGGLALTCVDESGRPTAAEFDLLVLSVGFEAPDSAVALARQLGIDLTPYGFARTEDRAPVASSRTGVIVAGCYREPKDIPDTMPEAAAAAAEAARFLRAPEPADTQPQPVVGDTEAEPRIGVVLCSCGADISRTIDFPLLTQHAEHLRGVVAVTAVGDACRADSSSLGEWARHEGVNRLVIAACTPRLKEGALEDAVHDAGVDPSLLWRVNLREQCAWVHRENPSAATVRAEDMIAMAVARASYSAPARAGSSPRGRQALVIGAGLAGMTAALTLTGLGHPVTLVDKELRLGGRAASPAGLAEDPDLASRVSELVSRVEAESAITVLTEAQVVKTAGFGGQFHSTIRGTGTDAEARIDHATVIVATGGSAAEPHEYLYGQHHRVLLQGALSRALAGGAECHAALGLDRARSVVMIQCVGSREPGRPYCSRTCCTEAVSNAIRLKELRPDLQLTVLFRDIRTFGQRELLYQRARELGVVFLRYELPNKPRVTAQNGALTVLMREPVAGVQVELLPDVLVLSSGVVPADNAPLAGKLGVDLDENGFFKEQHPKLRPMDLSRPGMYVCGLARGPCGVDEVVAQAQGAAMRAAAFMALSQVADNSTLVSVNKRLCSFCGLCVSACPYGARALDYDERVALVIGGLCQGCGICAVVCPNKATQQQTAEHRPVLAEIDAAIHGL